MDITTIKMAMLAMSDKNAVAKEVAKKLGITTTTLYMYINGDGTAKEVELFIIFIRQYFPIPHFCLT